MRWSHGWILFCIAGLVCGPLGCQSGGGDDPTAAELQVLVDRALDVSDLLCPAVEDSRPFMERARNPIYRVNKDSGTISLTSAGVHSAAMKAINLVESGQVYPELQQAVDQRLPVAQLAETRALAQSTYDQLLARQGSFSQPCRELLDSYAVILAQLDEMQNLVQNAGQDAAFYVKYPVLREMYMLRLEDFSRAVEQGQPDTTADPGYRASRERYMQAAADYLMSPAHDLTKGEGDD